MDKEPEQDIIEVMTVLHYAASLPFEIRALAKGKVYSCIFDHYPEEAELRELFMTAPEGANFFCTIQQARQGAAERYRYLIGNKLKATRHNLKDEDIERYKKLLIDLDPDRPAGTSSTNEELECARQLALTIKSDLAELGFSEPMFCLSGNGYHLQYGVDFPADAEHKELVHEVLKALDKHYSTDTVDVDISVNNPARVCKLYGTVAKKGEHTPERPHRLSKIISAPEELDENSEDLLREMIAVFNPPEEELPPVEQENEPALTTSSKEISADWQAAPQYGEWHLREYLINHNIRFTEEHKPSRADSVFMAYVACPNRAAHTNETGAKDSAVWEDAAGVKYFKCFHNHCESWKWTDFQEYYEPGHRERLLRDKQIEDGLKRRLENQHDADAEASNDSTTVTKANARDGVPVFVADNQDNFDNLAGLGCYVCLAQSRKERGELLVKILQTNDEDKPARLFVYTFDDRDSIKAIDATREGAFLCSIEDIRQADTMAEWWQTYIRSKSNSPFVTNFLQDISAPKDFIQTGFPELDKALGGGLIPSLTVVGAMPALGKTAFILQMADYIAAHGRPVLYFSLEMGKAELVSRSISRATYASNMRPRDRVDLPCTNQEILMGEFNKQADQKQLVQKVVEDYAENIAPNLYIFEGVGDITVDEIRHNIEKHIAVTGKKPVVFIDYLQIIKADNDKLNEKQVIDRAAVELKRLSRDLQLSIVVITSYNRASYGQPATMAAGKESGAIEYTADNLLDLHHSRAKHKMLEVFDEKTGTTKKKKESKEEYEMRQGELEAKNEQRIKNGQSIKVGLKLLKCRNGARANVYFAYTKKYHFYTDNGMALEELADDLTDDDVERIEQGAKKRWGKK